MDVIPGAAAVTPAGLAGPTAILVEGGRIVDVQPTDEATPEWILAPGFVDLQVNGAGSVDVATAEGSDWDDLDAHLVAHGVTTWCPTLITAPLTDYDAPLARIAEAAARPGTGRPAIAGAHLEGPFLGGAPGAHPPQHIRAVDLGWLDTLPPIVRIMTLAPEQSGATEAVQSLFQRGVVVALGHSTATHEEAQAALDAGARLVTHCFNGMGPFHHREPGLVGAALADVRVAVSLIADLVHVHPAALTVAWRAKGPANVVLVSDSVAHDAGRIGEVEVAVGDSGGPPRLADGTLAGTTLTLDRAVANTVHRCGIPLPFALAAASTNPARLLGLSDRGSLVPGNLADIVALDDALQVVATWVGGVPAYQR